MRLSFIRRSQGKNDVLRIINSIIYINDVQVIFSVAAVVAAAAVASVPRTSIHAFIDKHLSKSVSLWIGRTIQIDRFMSI